MQLLFLLVALPLVLSELPSLSSLSSSWQTYHRGLYPDIDPTSYDSLPHGIALPTANSLVGSLIASENVFAVRSITFPPYTQGPYSTVSRNDSKLGLLTVDGDFIYVDEYVT